jgi:preprotein translocase subunit SecF
MSRLGQVGGMLYRGEVSVNFVGKRRMWYSISAVIIVISLAALIIRGLDFSVEFTGGAVFTVQAPNASVSQVQKAVADGGVNGAIVQAVGSGSKQSWQVQTSTLTNNQTTNVENSLARELGVTQNDISVNSVGPSWGSQISSKAIQALIAFVVVIVLYLSIAFEWKMAVAAFVALVHTLIITVGVYALVHLQVSPATVIGFLTILGYALYDTVVVFDKVRENTSGLLSGARSTYSEAANLALNQTLVRSINTSLIALLPVGAILFVGGGLLGVGELKDLSLVLFIGILAGAYASICIATPVLAQLKEREPQYQALAKRVATRASGRRAAKRAATKAAAAGVPAAIGSSAAMVDDETSDAGYADDTDPDASAADQLTPTASRVPAARPTPGAARPGPRQQPRRSGGSARHRPKGPAGKKKRR